MITARGILSAVILIACTFVAGCATPYAKYDRAHSRQVDEYYSVMPVRQYREIKRISVTFNEVGVFTGKGSDELIVDMLKDKAAELGANGIISIDITTERMPLETNLQWIGRAIAIEYTDK
jgi:hypothetical protein